MGLFVKIAAHEHLQQLITVELADQGARGVVIGDIGGILGKDIADDLIDGIVALVLQRGINGRQDMTDLVVLFFDYVKFTGEIIHFKHPSLLCLQYIRRR